jgi:hypothetical protein
MLPYRPCHPYPRWPERNEFFSLELLRSTSPSRVDEMESIALPKGVDDANEGACGGRRCAFPPYALFMLAFKMMGVGAE